MFTRTKQGANKLCDQLMEDGLTAEAIHGDKSQGARTRTLANFKSGTGIVVSLVCIDEQPLLKNIERVIKKSITREVIAGYEPKRRIKAEATVKMQGHALTVRKKSF